MKNKTTEKIFKQIQQQICNKFKFSLNLEQDSTLLINYNEGKGLARLQLNGDMYGVYDFLDMLKGHKNLIEQQTLETSQAVVENVQPACPGYKITRRKVYFDADFKLTEKTAGAMLGLIVKCEGLPGVTIVKHDRFNGQAVSLLYNGFLFEFNEHFKGNQIKQAIEKIQREGVESIIEQVTNYATAA